MYRCSGSVLLQVEEGIIECGKRYTGAEIVSCCKVIGARMCGGLVRSDDLLFVSAEAGLCCMAEEANGHI